GQCRAGDRLTVDGHRDRAAYVHVLQPVRSAVEGQLAEVGAGRPAYDGAPRLAYPAQGRGGGSGVERVDLSARDRSRHRLAWQVAEGGVGGAGRASPPARIPSDGERLGGAVDLLRLEWSCREGDSVHPAVIPGGGVADGLRRVQRAE